LGVFKQVKHNAYMAAHPEATEYSFKKDMEIIWEKEMDDEMKAPYTIMAERNARRWGEVKMTTISAPLFGPAIDRALTELLAVPGLRRYLLATGVRLPGRKFDTFWKKKLDKVDVLLERLKTTAPAAEQKIREFLDEAKVFKGPRDEWYALLGRHLPSDWAERCQYEEALRMFGVPDTEAKALTVEDCPKKPGTSWAHEHFRWVTKAMCSDKAEGCFADVVNLCFSTLGLPQPDNKDPGAGALVVGVVNEVRQRLESLDMQGLWTADLHYLDMENDDMLSQGLNDYIRLRQGKLASHKVYQIPTASKFELLAVAREHTGNDVLRDQNSGNWEALEKYWLS
jgi:hypothetical protein